MIVVATVGLALDGVDVAVRSLKLGFAFATLRSSSSRLFCELISGCVDRFLVDWKLCWWKVVVGHLLLALHVGVLVL